MVGWLSLLCFLVAFIATDLFVKGKKRMKNILVVQVVNDPQFPKKNADVSFTPFCI